MRFLNNELQRLKEYSRIAEIGDIARRYFAMNAFDGILTMIGVLMGNYAAQVEDATIVVSTGLATCIAMGISGLWGAYLTEAAERKRDLNALEDHTLTDLSRSKVGRASRAAVIIVALIDGSAPLLASLVVLIPFLFSALLRDTNLSYRLSLGMALAALFALGAFLGKLSKEGVLLSGLKMIVAGLLSIALSHFLRVSR